jgi:hypothetical protein
MQTRGEIIVSGEAVKACPRIPHGGKRQNKGLSSGCAQKKSRLSKKESLLFFNKGKSG